MFYKAWIIQDQDRYLIDSGLVHSIYMMIEFEYVKSFLLLTVLQNCIALGARE